MGNGFSILIMLVVMMGLMFFMQRSQKKQADKRMESLNKLQKGYEVITIGGLYGTVDEVDTEKKTVVLDVDGVYLTFVLTAIQTVLPLTEGITAVAGADGSVDMSEDTAIEEEQQCFKLEKGIGVSPVLLFLFERFLLQFIRIILFLL